jgi:hypothetical protein
MKGAEEGDFETTSLLSTQTDRSIVMVQYLFYISPTICRQNLGVTTMSNGCLYVDAGTSSIMQGQVELLWLGTMSRQLCEQIFTFPFDLENCALLLM